MEKLRKPLRDLARDAAMTSQGSPAARLHFTTQLAYGAGDLGPSMAGNVLMVFFFFFLTSVAGLSPQQAGGILLLSNGWSALSTLFVGTLSDRTQTRWGRRRIWMLASAPILAFSFCLHWWVPPTAIAWRCLYYAVVAILFQTAANTFMIPYGALVAELSDDDGDRVRLTSLRFSFSLAGCIGSLLLAQAIAQRVYQPSQQLFDLGAICALATIGSIALCCWRTREQPRVQDTPARLSWRDWQLVLQNRPLLYLAGLYGLSWLALQITPALLPYFVIHCLDLDSAAIARVVVIVQGSAYSPYFSGNSSAVSSAASSPTGWVRAFGFSPTSACWRSMPSAPSGSMHWRHWRERAWRPLT
ncbi:MAG: MFS transporter [Spirulinaceae cyanobacterium SM2_1_0]|nr:MFS transporter [Spirulinaceae cyanobacterium SM2_1_0]